MSIGTVQALRQARAALQEALALRRKVDRAIAEHRKNLRDLAAQRKREVAQ